MCWFFKTQKCVTLSTSEAEYVAFGDTVKEFDRCGVSCHGVRECHAFQSLKTIRGTVQLSQNPVSNS